MSVNPAPVVFAKSTYPASGEDIMQVSVDSKNAAKSGLWYIRLRVKKRVNGAWEDKPPLRRITAVGFCATKEEAMSEVLDHRMGYEGFERRGGYWHAPIPKSNTGGVGGVGGENGALPPAAKKARVEGPVPPHGRRPIASGAGKRGAVEVNESPAMTTWTKKRFEPLPKTRST
jgi:hypothetical protein